MRTKISSVFVGAWVVISSSFMGCMATDDESARGSEIKTGYVVNQQYRVVVPLFIEKIAGGIGRAQLFLNRPGRIQNGPQTAEEYRQGNRKKWPKVVGLLEPKTVLRITRIEHEKDFELGHVFYVHAQVVDGEFSGEIVEISLVSSSVKRGSPAVWVPAPDLKLLEPIK